MTPQRGIFCTIALGLLTLTACESDPIGRTVPVKGKVTINGQPLKGGSVVYWPDEAKGNKSTFMATSQIGADGSYDLTTKGKPGAPQGAYKVTVCAQTEVDSTKPTTAKNLVAEVYGTKDNTPLQKEVTENAAGTYDLTVK